MTPKEQLANLGGREASLVRLIAIAIQHTEGDPSALASLATWQPSPSAREVSDTEVEIEWALDRLDYDYCAIFGELAEANKEGFYRVFELMERRPVAQGKTRMFTPWEARGFPISRLTFSAVVASGEHAWSLGLSRKPPQPDHPRWRKAGWVRFLSATGDDPRSGGFAKSEAQLVRDLAHNYDTALREYTTGLKQAGYPYEDTNEEYERYLSTNCQDMRIFGASVRLEDIKNLFIPLITNRPKFDTAHTYIVGRSGSGKSELIKTIFHLTGKRRIVIDPHGDLARDLAIIANRDAFLIAPHEGRFVINPFDISDKSEANRELVAQEITDLIAELVEDSGLSRLMTTIIFPIVYTLLKTEGADLRTLTECISPKHGGRRLQELRPHVERHHRAIWAELEEDTYDTSKQSIFNRLQSLLNYRLIIDSTTGRDDFADAIKKVEEGGSLIVSLPIPVIGEAVAVTLGRFFMTRLQIWAKRRQTIPERERTPVVLFADEFHNFLSHATAQTLDQFGRKFRLFMVLAHQHIGQITDREVRGSVLANTTNKIAGVSNSETRQTLAKEMLIGAEELEDLAIGNFYGRFGNKTPFRFYASMVKANPREKSAPLWQTKNAGDVATGETTPSPKTRRGQDGDKPKFDL
jgi:hypothetical protein